MTTLQPLRYQIALNNLTPTAANTNVVSIVPPANKDLRIVAITVWNPGKATAAQVTDLVLLSQTTLASGGTVATPLSNQNTPMPGVVRVGAFTGGTAGGVLRRISVFTPTAIAAFNPPLRVEFVRPVEVNAGTTGVLLRVENGAAGFTDLDVTIDVEA